MYLPPDTEAGNSRFPQGLEKRLGELEDRREHPTPLLAQTEVACGQDWLSLEPPDTDSASLLL
jgi:hypothetical protein